MKLGNISANNQEIICIRPKITKYQPSLSVFIRFLSGVGKNYLNYREFLVLWLITGVRLGCELTR